MPERPTGTVSLLFTDIEGSTRLLRRLGDRYDGGVLNNLPIDVMADTAEGPVVAVDVMRPFTGRRAAPAATRGLRGGGTAADPEHGGVLPPIAEILTRVSVLGSWRAVEQSRPRAILTITVPDTGTGMLEWNRLDAMVRVGRHARRGGAAEPRVGPVACGSRIASIPMTPILPPATLAARYPSHAKLQVRSARRCRSSPAELTGWMLPLG